MSYCDLSPTVNNWTKCIIRYVDLCLFTCAESITSVNISSWPGLLVSHSPLLYEKVKLSVLRTSESGNRHFLISPLWLDTKWKYDVFIIFTFSTDGFLSVTDSVDVKGISRTKVHEAKVSVCDPLLRWSKRGKESNWRTYYEILRGTCTRNTILFIYSSLKSLFSVH